MIVLSIMGEGARSLFEHETGGHRWQRIPPTERSGRVHSSTITVAVIPGAGVHKSAFNPADVSMEALCGHGPGGQKKNKTASAIRAIHRPTGKMVFIQTERGQQDNKRLALEELRRRVESEADLNAHQQLNGNRKTQIGRGERSDKVRTVQCQNDRVTNHVNGRKMTLNAYLKGEIWRLH